MKRILLFAFILAVFPNYAQWRWLNPSPHGSDFNAVYFISPSTGWIGASDGKIFKTTDGGNSWEEKSVCTVWNTIRDIYFIDETKAAAVGQHDFDLGDVRGFIMNSVDGGISWNIVYTESFSINGLAFSSSQTGYAVGDEVIYKSNDQGISWFKQFVHPFNLSDVDAVSELVVAAGADGAILRSTNAGSSWHIVSSGTAQDLNNICFIDNLTGYAVGASGTIIKTTNSGLSWTNLNSGTLENLTSVVFTSLINGVIAGNNGTILRTTDGGSSWHLKNSNPSQHLHSIYMINQSYGIAAGIHGSKAATTDGGETWISDYKPLINTDYVYDGLYIKRNTIIISGNRGIFRSTDRGNTWASVSSFNFYDLSFADSSSGLGFRNEYKNGHTFSEIGRTSDGGQTWMQSLYDTMTVYGISYVKNSKTAYMTAKKNMVYNLYKTTDGGINWSKINGFVYFTTIYFFDEVSGIAVRGDRIFRTTDGGLNWIDQNAPVLYDGISYMSFTTSGAGIAASHEGGWMRTTDFGATWTIGSGGALSHILDVSITEAGTLTITSGCWNPNPPIAGGAIMRSTDMGQTWSLYRSSASFRRINFLDENDGIVIGGGGAVLAFSSNDPVPVELAGFSASINGNDVHLYWNTIAETNNRGFEVQRKNETEFETLNFVSGSGSSSEIKNYSYIDKDISSGKYLYRLKQIDYDGTFAYSNEIEVDFNTSPVFSLSQCYPNPFNPSTKINYSIAKEGNASLILFDVLGQEVRKIFDEHKLIGSYTLEINASDLPSGIYFYTLKSGVYSDTKKMILLR